MSFSALDVKNLREQTNAPMMECKKALADAGGDMEQAKKLLRERGIAKMAKRADRETAEGVVRIAVGPGNVGGTAIIVTCETDFTAKNEQFQRLADGASAAAAGLPGNELTPDQVLEAKHEGKSVRQMLEDVANAIRENMSIAQTVRFGGVCGGYVHFDGRTGVLVEAELGDMSKAGQDSLATLLRNVAMHVTAADPAPLAVDAKGIDPKTVEEEKEILVKQAMDSGKPEDIARKMVAGRMQKFYSERALLEQMFVMNPEKTVGQFVQEGAKTLGTTVNILRFKRMQIGG